MQPENEPPNDQETEEIMLDLWNFFHVELQTTLNIFPLHLVADNGKKKQTLLNITRRGIRIFTNTDSFETNKLRISQTIKKIYSTVLNLKIYLWLKQNLKADIYLLERNYPGRTSKCMQFMDNLVHFQVIYTVAFSMSRVQ